MAVLKFKPKRKVDAPKPVAPTTVEEPAADAQPSTPAAAPASEEVVGGEPVAGPSGSAPEDALADDAIPAAANEPEATEEEQLREMKHLRRILQYVEGAQTANTNYSITLGATLSTISHAKTRFNELAVCLRGSRPCLTRQNYTEALVEDLELDPSLDIEVPGMVEVILPWHPHFHGQVRGSDTGRG